MFQRDLSHLLSYTTSGGCIIAVTYGNGIVKKEVSIHCTPTPFSETGYRWCVFIAWHNSTIDFNGCEVYCPEKISMPCIEEKISKQTSSDLFPDFLSLLFLCSLPCRGALLGGGNSDTQRTIAKMGIFTLCLNYPPFDHNKDNR